MTLGELISKYSGGDLDDDDVLTACCMVEDNMYVSETAKQVLEESRYLMLYLQSLGFERG